MPSTSGQQHRLMEARAHGAKFAMAKKIPLSVANDFVNADKKYGKFRKKKRNKHFLHHAQGMVTS